MRHLLNPLDFSVEEIDQLLDLASDIEHRLPQYAHVCDGKKIATLFYEPSTRTRLSFESAMLSLGGSVLGFSSADSSSAAKGESVADTIRIISCYADICAMRHPKEGAPLVAANHSSIPLRHQTPRHMEKEKQPFILPAQAVNNDILYRYLTADRAVLLETVDFFVSQGLVYEECRHHNIVFKGNDKNGITRFASMRGTDGSSFKCDVAGNDKNYGFNIWNDRSGSLYVFEAAIDLMSFAGLYGDYESNKLALGMLHDAPLATFLKEHTQVKNIYFCLDRDGPGRKASDALCQKYYGLGFEAEDCPPPEPFKDYNEWLVSVKKCQPVSSRIIQWDAAKPAKKPARNRTNH